MGCWYLMTRLWISSVFALEDLHAYTSLFCVQSCLAEHHGTSTGTSTAEQHSQTLPFRFLLVPWPVLIRFQLRSHFNNISIFDEAENSEAYPDTHIQQQLLSVFCCDSLTASWPPFVIDHTLIVSKNHHMAHCVKGLLHPQHAAAGLTAAELGTNKDCTCWHCCTLFHAMHANCFCLSCSAHIRSFRH